MQRPVAQFPSVSLAVWSLSLLFADRVCVWMRSLVSHAKPIRDPNRPSASQKFFPPSPNLLPPPIRTKYSSPHLCCMVVRPTVSCTLVFWRPLVLRAFIDSGAVSFSHASAFPVPGGVLGEYHRPVSLLYSIPLDRCSRLGDIMTRSCRTISRMCRGHSRRLPQCTASGS